MNPSPPGRKDKRFGRRKLAFMLPVGIALLVVFAIGIGFPLARSLIMTVHAVLVQP